MRGVGRKFAVQRPIRASGARIPTGSLDTQVVPEERRSRRLTHNAPEERLSV